MLLAGVERRLRVESARELPVSGFAPAQFLLRRRGDRDAGRPKVAGQGRGRCQAYRVGVGVPVGFGTCAPPSLFMHAAKRFISASVGCALTAASFAQFPRDRSKSSGVAPGLYHTFSGSWAQAISKRPAKTGEGRRVICSSRVLCGAWKAFKMGWSTATPARDAPIASLRPHPGRSSRLPGPTKRCARSRSCLPCAGQPSEAAASAAQRQTVLGPRASYP